jgi:formylglycine-generating enzyme required for sulfatase activity
MNCPYCSEQHPDNARFCPVTGQTIPEQLTCAGCGRETKAGVKFCPYCGSTTFLDKPKAHLKLGRKKRATILWTLIGVVALFFAVVVGLFFFDGLSLQSQRLISNLRSPSETPTQESERFIRVADIGNNGEDSIQATDTPTTTVTPQPTVTWTPTPTITLSATPVPTYTHTPQPTSTPTSYTINPNDGSELIFIPPGEFFMGSNPNSDPYFWGSEGPMHRVSLDGYWIYRTEVTNAMYQACVNEVACPRPAYTRSATRPEYFGNPIYADYPVIFVSWRDAAAYCRWAGGRLPSEAEWEKAARGEDGRLFPWGNQPPDGEKVNFCDWNCSAAHRDPSHDDGYRDTAPVGNYLAGASPYGVLDMAGNVWEWTFDWFQEAYYKVSPELNPLGPASGTRRVIRGGSWFNPAEGLRTVARASYSPETTLESLGFRCVVDNP